MNLKPYDFSVFIGRFQPLHIGHEQIIRRALERSSQVIVLIGSANEAVSIKNPWSADQRRHFIESVFRYEVANGRILIGEIGNHPSNERWAADARDEVRFLLPDHEYKNGAITGFGKDASSDYLKWFPEWEPDLVDVQIGTFNATDVRHAYFNSLPTLPSFICPQPVLDYLLEFRLTDQFKHVMEEKLFLDAYHESWSHAPYPPTFLTVDAVVEQNKQVLLVRRRGCPGKGLLALPGGFVNKGEPIRDAAIRELREETAISDARGRIPAGRLGDFIREDRTKVFDDPFRDLRGRTITFAHFFKLPDGEQYKVKGEDDAEHAQWYPIGPNLDPRDFYADHYHIIAHFFGL